MLDHRTFLVKEKVSFLRLSDRYDIYDPETGEALGVAKEEIGMPTKLLRLLLNKALFPTTVVIRESEDGPAVLQIRRGFSFLRAKVTVVNSSGELLGYFKSKLFSLGGGFLVYDANDQQMADVKGNWIGWTFEMLDMQGNVLGRVTKKWAGAMKEIFTSADNYVIALDEKLPANAAMASLLLAAGLAIDLVFKEKNN